MTTRQIADRLGEILSPATQLPSSVTDGGHAAVLLAANLIWVLGQLGKLQGQLSAQADAEEGRAGAGPLTPSPPPSAEATQ